MKGLSKRKLLITVAVGLLVAVLIFLFVRPKSTNTAQAAPPTEVEVIAVEQKDVPIYTEWIGTLDGMVNAEIKIAGDGLPLEQRLHGRLVRHQRPVAV